MADDLSQQAASQQSPGAPVPLPINPAQAVMGVPPQTQSAAPTGAPQQQTTAVQTQPSPDQQIQAHHSALGATVRHIFDSLEGRQTVYQPQPDGTVSPVSVQRKPGAFFRDLVGGVMAGMAASSAPTEHPSGAAGLGRGFLGAQDYLQNQQQGRRAAAQETATAQKALRPASNSERDHLFMTFSPSRACVSALAEWRRGRSLFNQPLREFMRDCG
jgi:hypothetical protein